LQTTIEKSFSHVGTGVHLGRPARVIVRPAPKGHGLVFKRTDVEDKISLIPASYKNVTRGELCTSLANFHGIRVITVEHLLAALSGVGVSNALIEIDNEEVPILDGSSERFVHSIINAGIKEQEKSMMICSVTKEIKVEDGKSWVKFEPADELILTIIIDYPNTIIGKQSFSLSMSNGSFIKELSNCRTFCLKDDIQHMHSLGLALGGSLDNAIVVDKFKVLNPGGLRRVDEFVRHKMLDALGDLALSGLPIFGHFTSFCGGHRLNNKLLGKLFSSEEFHKFLPLINRDAYKLLGYKYSSSILSYKAVS